MTRTLAAGMLAEVALPTGEATTLIQLDFADLSNNPTPVYLTTAGRDLVWNAITWQAVGGNLDVDALGESTDGQASGLRVRLSGVDQAVLALILGARWRGRTATVWYAHLNQSNGAIIADPVLLFSGLMNGGFETAESRGDFGGGAVDITTRLTAKLTELVRVRGVRCNLHSHQSAIPGATADTFFQNVAQLPLRRIYWGTKAPSDAFNPGNTPMGDPRQMPGPQGSPWPTVVPGTFGGGGASPPPPPPPPETNNPWGLGPGTFGGG